MSNDNTNWFLLTMTEGRYHSDCDPPIKIATLFESAHRNVICTENKRECGRGNGILKTANMEREKCDISFYTSICN